MNFKSRLENSNGESQTVHATARGINKAAQSIAEQFFGKNVIVRRTKGGKGLGFRAFKKATKRKDEVAAGKCFHVKQVNV